MYAPSPVGIDPHFPAFAVLRETEDCAIVRAPREVRIDRRQGEEAFSWDAVMERE